MHRVLLRLLRRSDYHRCERIQRPGFALQLCKSWLTYTAFPADAYAGRWHEGSRAAQTTDNFNAAAAALDSEMLELLSHSCTAGSAACTPPNAMSGEQSSSTDICGFAQCDDVSNSAALTEYCRRQGGPFNTITALCRGQFENSEAIADLCAGFASTTSDEAAAVRRVLVDVCVNLGIDATRCGPAAAAASAGYATCDALVAAESEACSVDFVELMATAASPSSGNQDNSAAQHSTIGCALLGTTLGASVGLATTSMRAFEVAANQANVEAACRASGDPESWNYDVCVAVDYELSNEMCSLYAASEGGDEAAAGRDVAELLCLELGFPGWGCAGYRDWFARNQAEGRWLTCGWTAETFADMCAAVSAELYWCSSTCDNAVTYWGGADDSLCATVGLARNNGGASCGWGADGNGHDDGCGFHRTGERCNADCADGQGCTADDCPLIGTIVSDDAFAGRWDDGALAANNADHFNAAADSLSDVMNDMVSAACDVAQSSDQCTGHEYSSMCATGHCEVEGNVAVLEAFCNEQGGAAATVFALCESTFADTETIASLCAGYSETATSEATAVRATLVSTCANFGFAAATCGDAAAAAGASFPTCASISSEGLSVCSALTAALLPDSGQAVGIGCASLANTIGESVGMATEAIGAFQNAANSDNVEAMCLESGDPYTFVVDNCGGIGYEFANQMCEVYAAAEGGDEAKANGDVMELICREQGYNHFVCDSYRTWINWNQDDGRFLSCSWTAETWGDMCEAVVAEMGWCSSTCNVNVPYFGGGGLCEAVGLARNEGLEPCGWGSEDTSWVSGVSGGGRNGWSSTCGYHRTGEYCNADCAVGQGCIPEDCAILASIVTDPNFGQSGDDGSGFDADCVAAGNCAHANVAPTGDSWLGGRWHQGSTAAVSQENFNNAAATLPAATMDALHATCDAVGTTATCSGHEFDSFCSMSSCEDEGNAAALTMFCSNSGGTAPTVTRMCASQMDDSDAITDLCDGFVASTSTESAAVAATVASVCTNVGFDAEDCAGVAGSTGIASCADLVAAGSAICAPLADAAAEQFPTCEDLGASLGDSVALASSAVGAFEYAANTEHVNSMCRAAGNPLHFCIDHCLMTSADYANDMCDIFAAGESGNEAKANEDIMVMTCLDIGWPTWGCEGYRWWTQQRQAEGLFTNCDWTPPSWQQHCEAACNDHFWCASTCDPEIPFFAEGGTIAGACDDTGRSRNDGFDSTCGWQGDFSAPRCDLPATGTYCDEDCAAEQGCNEDDCAILAWVATDDALEGRWADGGFSINTAENGADTFNAAAASLSDDMADMLRATCATVGTVATCAGHDHESLCSQLECGDDPSVCCPEETSTCMADPDCVALLSSADASADACFANDGCAAIAACMMGNEPCGEEQTACMGDVDCNALMGSPEPPDDAVCAANAPCAAMMQCFVGLDPDTGR